MPRLVSKHTPPPPPGYSEIKDQLEDFTTKMAEAVRQDDKTLDRNETLWSVSQVDFRRTRFLYEQYYIYHNISRELYDWCMMMGYGNKELAQQWRKPGYGKLCCLRCMQTTETEHGTVCACRVPPADLKNKSIQECGCRFCGCHGCGQGPLPKEES